MLNFKKALNLKILSICIAVLFLFQNLSYGIDISNKSNLRVPISRNTANRMKKALDPNRRKFFLALGGGLLAAGALRAEPYQAPPAVVPGITIPQTYQQAPPNIDTTQSEETIESLLSKAGYSREAIPGIVQLFNKAPKMSLGYIIDLYRKEYCNVKSEAGLRDFIAKLRRDVDNSGYLDELNLLLKALVSKLDPAEDIFTLIKQAEIPLELKTTLSKELTYCSSKAELTYIILRLIGIKNAVMFNSYNHVSVAIQLVNSRYLIVDFANDLFTEVELSESDASPYYKKGGYWFLKEKHKLSSEKLYSLSQRYKQQEDFSSIDLTEQQKLNLFYPDIYISQADAVKSMTLPVFLKRLYTYIKLIKSLSGSDPRRAFFIKKAMEENQRIKEINPDYSESYETLGIVYLNIGEFRKALDLFKEAEKLNSQKATIHCNLGIAHFNLTEFPEAMAEQNKAIELDPYLEQAYNNIGEIHFKSNDYEAAKNIYQKGLDRLPDSMLLRYNLGCVYYKLGEYPEAIKEFEKAAKLSPDNWLILFNMGEANFSNEQYEEALKAFIKAKKLNPKNWEIHYKLGCAHYNLNNIPAAIKSWKDALELIPSEKETAKRAIIEKVKEAEGKNSLNAFRQSSVVLPLSLFRPVKSAL